MLTKPPVREVGTAHVSLRDDTPIDHIVIHYTTSRNLEGVVEHFKNGEPRVSTHYIVGQNGELVQMVHDDLAAWGAGDADMNRRSIQIEHCAEPGDKITPKQERVSAALIRWLVETYSIPHESIIPHCAVHATNCPGDLFADYGGRGGASVETQRAALAKWLRLRVFAEPKPELVATAQEEPKPAPIGHNGGPPIAPKSPAQSLTVWGGIVMGIAGLLPSIGDAIGLPISTEFSAGLAGLAMTILGRFGANVPVSFKRQ